MCHHAGFMWFWGSNPSFTHTRYRTLPNEFCPIPPPLIHSNIYPFTSQHLIHPLILCHSELPIEDSLVNKLDIIDLRKCTTFWLDRQ